MEIGTILKWHTTLYKVIEWNENSELCILQQINKADTRHKVFKKAGILEAIDNKKMKVVK